MTTYEMAGFVMSIRQWIIEDLSTASRKDPACPTRRQAVLHQGVHAIWAHRLTHRIHLTGHREIARTASYVSRIVTGVDLHPGAVIGPRVFVDHGAGVVIGEDAVIESDVMMYHNVTIGSVGWWRPKLVNGRRHPTIGARTVLCTGAMILGPITVGEDCVVGANAIVLADVPSRTHISPGQLWRGVSGQPCQDATVDLPQRVEWSN
jgi:serine O-acetyltransferase